MGYFQTIEVSGEDVDDCIEIVEEHVDAGVEDLRQLSGGYYFVDVYIQDDNESDRLENALDNHNLEWSWLWLAN